MAKEEKKKAKRPTAAKRLIQAEKRRLINKNFKSKMRTGIRNFQSAVTQGDKQAIEAALNLSYSLLDKAAKRGLIKRNKASRDKARMAAKMAAALSA
jgi:small subunit ribosomal protein S20